MINRTNFRYAVLVVFVCLIAMGCSPRYRITQNLEEPIGSGQSVKIGVIADALPADTDLDNHPSEGDINKLRIQLQERLMKEELFGICSLYDNGDYEVVGSILEYKKGSGFVRFLIGFGAGKAVVTTELKLVDSQSGSTLFAANFKGQVTSYTASGDEMYKTIAKDFAKALKKDLEKLTSQ